MATTTYPTQYGKPSEFAPALRSVISAPLTDGDTLIGVLSGYCSREAAFTEEHRYAVEQLALVLAERLLRATTVPRLVVAFRGSKA